MSYIGNQSQTAYSALVKQTITGNNGTSYTLSHPVSNENDILLYINNVKQEGGAGKAFTASGTTLTLSEAIASSDSCYVQYIGLAIQTVVPPDGSVSTAKIADGAVSSAKIANSAVNLTSKVTGVLPVANGGNGLLEYSRGAKSTQTTINSATPLDVGVRAKLNPTNNAQVIRVNWQWSYHDATHQTAQHHELEYRLGTGSWTALVIWADYVVHITTATNQYSTANLAWYGLASTLSASGQVLEFRPRVATQSGAGSSWILNDPLGGNAWSAGQLTFIEAHLYDGGIYTAGTDV